MINVVTTIIPIFVIIVLGWLARVCGFIRAEFISPANRLVFYLAIPAMVFRSVSKASLNSQFDGRVVTLAVLSCGLLKLILLPAIGFVLYRLFNVMPEAYLPGIILLA
ncbi:MAG: AEC family transporter, partial [Desulfobacterales bacterium]